jgi:hypothetical protein
MDGNAWASSMSKPISERRRGFFSPMRCTGRVDGSSRHGVIVGLQRIRTIARDAFHGLLRLVERLLAQGRSCEQILEVLMPA